MVGVTLLHGFERGAERWHAGAIYNPKDGRTYRARMELVSQDTLAVSGCLGPICKTLLWQRAKDEAQDASVTASNSEAELASLD